MLKNIRKCSNKCVRGVKNNFFFLISKNKNSYSLAVRGRFDLLKLID